MQREQNLESLAARLVDVLTAIATCEDAYKRRELMFVYSHLLLEIPDDQPSLRQETQDILEDVNTEFMEYDPQAKQGFYRDDKRVLHQVVKALWAIGWELVELRCGEHSKITDQEEKRIAGPKQVEQLVQRLLTVLVVIAACGDPYLRRGWSFHLSYLLRDRVERQPALTEETWTVLEDVSRKLASHEPSRGDGSWLSTVVRRFSRRRESGSYSHTHQRGSCNGDATTLRHVVKALAGIARGADI